MAKKASSYDEESWDRIFEEVELNAVPIEYVKSISITFHDGTIWRIDVDNDNVEVDDARMLEASLDEFLHRNEEDIGYVDFRLDTEKVKKDIHRITLAFTKRRK